ncbi:hypothetical protein CfE428DRAFT_0624 [Chthoniobacter flavus Ellin428]|uniref:HEAT repeat domain-containing protein n=1 Tax=Chthoniobacter flavus Ellin428 TaxID=497964 RepID=B4CVD7_9BACT|nr:hypothetical protein [Chthoniobacter flavus]EDY21379.1 hypothetical protein CfE428DRAFT_0624 [Chthoniobacter flavus Ellin428]TCO95343.1 hypothetical protein EV701_10129 [Chthoniobacter flavus]
MKVLRLSFFLFLAVTWNCLAQDKESRRPWQEVRDQQPAGVHLTMTLPKTHYHLGEVITATLKFSNETAAVYHLAGPSGGRSGRVQDVAFRAKAEDGSFVSDPLQWYLENHFLMGGGGGTAKRLGDWEFSLAANQWLQFDKPGTYQLYAWTSCLAVGERYKGGGKLPIRAELVSDPVTITIEPMTAGEEKKIIDEAVQVLNAPRQPGRFDPAFDAMERLRFLQTPAASDVLLQYVDAPYSGEAWFAFFGRPNYAAAAAHILALVQEGRLGLSEGLLYLYSTLKSGSFRDLLVEGSGQRPDLAAREELYLAARQVIERGGSSPAFFADLFSWYQRNPKDLEIRSLLIRRQLELPQKQIDLAFGDEPWRMREEGLLREKDFLPLIRELAKPGKHSPNALEALAKLAPEEAKPVIVEDIRLNRPVYQPPPNVDPGNRDFRGLAALPDRELPELDAPLRERLARDSQDGPGLEATMLLVDRYATKALLPDVLRFFHGKEGHWQCVLQAATLRYWIRCDRMAGLESLERALGKNGPNDTGCYRMVLTDVLGKNWVDEATPLVLRALNNDDPEVVRDAVRLLEAHGGPETVEMIIAKIEAAAADLPEDSKRRDQRLPLSRSLIRSLLDNKRWTLTHAQLERLQKLTTERMLQDQLKRMLQQSDK